MAGGAGGVVGERLFRVMFTSTKCHDDHGTVLTLLHTHTHSPTLIRIYMYTSDALTFRY